jgi:hypothetical protein
LADGCRMSPPSFCCTLAMPWLCLALTRKQRFHLSAPVYKRSLSFLPRAMQSRRGHHCRQWRARSSAWFPCQPTIPGPPLGPPVAAQVACCSGRAATSLEQNLQLPLPPVSAVPARRSPLRHKWALKSNPCEP